MGHPGATHKQAQRTLETALEHGYPADRIREILPRTILQTTTRVPNKKGHTRPGVSLTFRSIIGRSSLLRRRPRARQGQPINGAILTNHRLRRL